MITPSDILVSPLQTSVNELRAKSLQRITLLIAAICYLSIMWSLWPSHLAQPEMLVAALISAIMIVILSFIYMMRSRFPEAAAVLLIASLILAIGFLVIMMRSSQVVQLFVVPIIIAGVLMGQTAIIIVAGFVIGLQVLVISLFVPMNTLMLPLILIGTVTVAVLILTRNLYTALVWALKGHETALNNLSIARDSTEELHRALKSLATTSHNLHRANHALEIARSQADEARKLKQDFAQSISHELRTPLNLIVGFSETMIHSPEYYGSALPPLYTRDLSIVYRNACHLQSLVNDVLDLARIETANMGLQIEEIDLSQVAQEAADTARALVETRGLQFKAQIAADLPAVWVDPIRVRQIILNLLNNAARFTERGSVTLRVAREADEVVFAVADTGIGIAAEDLKHIFEPFRQVGDSGAATGGAGLGLTISQRLAELHGGSLQVESASGLGSTFCFRLPVVANEPSPGYLPEDPMRARSQIRSQNNLVLLITNNPVASATVSRYLHGCRTITIQDLAQAEVTIHQMMPQVVILDTSEGGYDTVFIQTIVQHWQSLKTYVIACPLPGQHTVKDKLAAQAYLTKPVSRDDLWDTLRQFGASVDNVLIVDDDRDFVRLVERMLDSPLKRYRISSANSGREALELMKFAVPDVILLDLNMADMDGFSVIERIRATPEWQQVLIVVVSAQDELETSVPLQGQVVISRSDGISSSEILRWLQGMVSDLTGRGYLALLDA